MLKKYRTFILSLIAAATLVVCFLLLSDWIPAIRGPVWLAGEWSWPYALKPLGRWWLPLLAAGLTILVAALWLRSKGNQRFQIAMFLLALMACSVILQLAIIYAGRPAAFAELVDRTLAVQTSGYFRAAAELDNLDDTLRNFPSLMPGFDSEHLRTHPPGLLIGNWLAIRIFGWLPRLSEQIGAVVIPLRCSDSWLFAQPAESRAALLVAAALPLLLAALSIPLAFGLAHELMSSSEAKLSTILVSVIPALLIFTPLADQGFAFLSLAALLLLVRAIKLRSLPWYFASGLALSLASMLSLGNLSLVIAVLLLIIFSARAGGNTRVQGRKMFFWLMAFGIGLGVMWVGYCLVWGVNPLDLALTSMNQHYELVTSKRNYGIWLGYNLVDLIIFSGPPLFIGFVGALIIGFRRVRRRTISLIDALDLSIGLLLLILLLSGSTRGEVGRIWLFVMPLMALAAGHFMADLFSEDRSRLLIIGLQMLVVLCLGLAWRPVEAVIVLADKPAMEIPEGTFAPVEASFSENISLTGYYLGSSKLQSGESLAVSLRWMSAGPAYRPYTVFAHIVDSNGDLVAQHDAWPVSGAWPPTCWRQGETIFDSFEIQLPAELAPGHYQVVVGLYDALSGERLIKSDGKDIVILGAISIVPR